MAAGPLLASAGFLLIAGVRAEFDFWTQLLPGLVLFGVGLSMTVSPLTATVLAAVDPARSGISSAVNNAVSRVAGLLAIANLGVIVGGTMDVAGFRRTAVITAALFAAAGVISAVGIVNTRVQAVASVSAARCLDRGR